jgi:hypothetical protein
MSYALKYIVDDNGAKTSVVVNIKQWEKINSDIKKLQEKLNIFQSINNGIREIRDAKKNGQELDNLSDFLNKSNS